MNADQDGCWFSLVSKISKAKGKIYFSACLKNNFQFNEKFLILSWIKHFPPGKTQFF